MKALKSAFYQPLCKLIEPRVLAPQPEQRRLARLLAWTLATIILISVILVPLSDYGESLAEMLTRDFVKISIGCTGLLLVALVLNREGHYQAATYLFLGVVLAGMMVFAATSNPNDNFLWLVQTPMGILLASIFCTWQVAAWISAVTNILVIVVPMLTLKISFLSSLTGPFPYVLSLTVIILLADRMRQLGERDRRARLEESEARYRRLVEMSPEAIVVITIAGGEILYANAAAARLYRASSTTQLLGKLYLEFAPPHYREMILRRVRGSEDIVSIELQHIALDGTLIEVESLTAEVMYAGKPARQIVVRDISERKQLEQQRLENSLERERTAVLHRFISDSSHDLRTPFTVVLSAAYLLEKFASRILEDARLLKLTVSTDDGAREVLRDLVKTCEIMADRATSMRENTQRLQRTMNSMLDMIRLEQTGEYNFEVRLLNPLVEQVIRTFAAQCAHNNQTLTFTAESGLLPVIMDEVEFGRVIQNLIENAVHYTPKGGAIRVLTRVDDEQAILEISDTGIGISEADQKHIFERFFRADSARSTHTGGSGLGLSISRAIVEKHQGRIEVESTLGKGSTFRVFLTRAPLSAEDRPFDLDLLAPTTQKRTIR